MHLYSCKYYHKKNNELELNANSFCWAGIRNQSLDLKNDENNYIYISDYEKEETKQYQERLIYFINKITPCGIVTEKNKKYIKFRILETYDQSLILLNFIRNLWYTPDFVSYYDKDLNMKLQKDSPKPFVSILFFKALEKKGKEREALKALTESLKEACEDWYNSPGHSNFHLGITLKVKTTKELLAYKGNETKEFLTT